MNHTTKFDMDESAGSYTLIGSEEWELSREEEYRKIVSGGGHFTIEVSRYASDKTFIGLGLAWSFRSSNSHVYFGSLGAETGLAILRLFVEAVTHDTHQLIRVGKRWVLPAPSTSEKPPLKDGVTIELIDCVMKKYFPSDMSQMEMLKLLVIREFSCLAYRVPLDAFMTVALAAGVTASDLIEPLLTFPKRLPVKMITAKYMELVKYGARPENGQMLLDLLFSDTRFNHSWEIDGEEYYDVILAHWASCGVKFTSDNPGTVANQVFKSCNPKYLHWFLTTYPDADLTIPGQYPDGTQSKTGPYAAMKRTGICPPAKNVEAIDAVLREFGRDAIIDHALLGMT